MMMNGKSYENGSISRGNLTVILSAAGLVMIAFGGFITFQSTNTDRRLQDLKEEIARGETKYLSKDEHNEFKFRVDRDFGLIRTEMQHQSVLIVPRAENEIRWTANEVQTRTLADRLNEQTLQLSRRIDELRTATTSTYTERDEIQRLQKDLADIRSELHRRAASSP